MMARFITIIIMLALFLLLGTACTITGRSAEVMSDGIVACSLNTDMEFLRLNGLVQACYRENSLYFIVENTGTSQVSGLSVQLESDYNLTMTIKEPIPPGETSQQSISFGSQGISGARSLRIYPLTGPNRNVCENAAIYTELERC
jgi:hypothetical protein